MTEEFPEKKVVKMETRKRQVLMGEVQFSTMGDSRLSTLWRHRSLLSDRKNKELWIWSSSLF